DEELHLGGALAFRKPKPHLLRRRWDHFAEAGPHHHRIREVDHVDGHRALLLPDRDVEHSRPGHGNRRLLIERPSDRVAQQASVIVFRASDVSTCFAVTSTPGRTPPEVSSTTPKTFPVVVWALSASAPIQIRIAIRSMVHLDESILCLSAARSVRNTTYAVDG